MQPGALIKIGAVGSVLAALCCFSPLLPIVLGGLGLTGMLSALYSDAVLIPVLLFFLAIAGWGLWLKRRQS